MTEEWRPVVGWEGLYEVSDAGRVKSLARLDAEGKQLRERIRKLLVNRKRGGYIYVPLWRSKQIMRKVHHLVLEAFVGPRPPGTEGAHLDGGPANNRRGNLAWKTHTENELDKLRHGRIRHGESHPHARLTDVDIERMRDLRIAGHTQKDIAAWLDTGKWNVQQMLAGTRHA